MGLKTFKKCFNMTASEIKDFWWVMLCGKGGHCWADRPYQWNRPLVTERKHRSLCLELHFGDSSDRQWVLRLVSPTENETSGTCEYAVYPSLLLNDWITGRLKNTNNLTRFFFFLQHFVFSVVLLFLFRLTGIPPDSSLSQLLAV